MQRTNIDFLKGQLSKSIETLFSTESLPLPFTDIYSATFKFQFDKDEKQVAKTNMDEIMFHWALPKLLDKELKVDELCDALIPGTNELPLWIKLKYLRRDNIFMLAISKRFRNKKIVQEWHETNDLFPIILEETALS